MFHRFHYSQNLFICITETINKISIIGIDVWVLMFLLTILLSYLWHSKDFLLTTLKMVIVCSSEMPILT